MWRKNGMAAAMVALMAMAVLKRMAAMEIVKVVVALVVAAAAAMPGRRWSGRQRR